MRNFIIGLMIAGGLMAQQFGTGANGVIDKSTPSGIFTPLGQEDQPTYKPRPGIIDCKTYSGRWTVAFRDESRDVVWMQGGILVQPVDSPEVRMSKKFIPYSQIIECDYSVVGE